MYMIPFRRMNTVFSPLFNASLMNNLFETSDIPEMRVDVREQPEAYLLEAELPGLNKEDIDLSVNNGTLTIRAEVNTHKKENRDGYICSERRSGMVERSFDIEGVDAEKIRADYRNGVLMVLLPKSAKPTGGRIAIGGEEMNKISSN